MDIQDTILALKGYHSKINEFRDDIRKLLEQKDEELREISGGIENIIKSLETRRNGDVDAAARPGTSAVKAENSVDLRCETQPQQGVKRPNEELDTSASKKVKNDLLTVENEFTIVHTDGQKVDSKAGWGIWWNDGHSENKSGSVVGGCHSDFTPKIQAALFAIYQAQKLNIKKLNVHTDCDWLINCMKENWIDKWKKNNWRTADKKPVKNKEDVQQLENIMHESGIDVKWTRVTKDMKMSKGHVEAQRLAKEGAKNEQS